jgi:hypothetical protein
MAIKLKKQASGSVANPPASHLAFFVDQNGLPSLKDSLGTVTPALSADGSPLNLTAVFGAPPSEALKVKLYSQTVFGVTEFFVEDDTGALIQITNQGSLAGPRINWKNGTPGNPYIVGDTANALFGEIVMVNVADPDVVTINLPAITPASAGLLVQIRNLVDKKGPNPGKVVLTPGVDDSIETFSTGQTVFPSNPFVYIGLESDGVGRWNISIMGGGSSVLAVFP